MADVNGTVESGFERVREVFEANFAERGEVGAACSVWVGGREVVDLAGGVVAPGGAPYTRQTLQMVASATKGAMAICALRLAERGELDLDAPVATYWPEFAAAGKAELPVRWLLTHQAGLPYADPVIPMAQVYRWTPMTDALAAQAPVWEPGAAHGYHAMTYGWLVGEVLARVTGTSAGEVLRKEVADPLGIDFFVGLPEPEFERVAPLRPAPVSAEPDPLTVLMIDPNQLAHRAFFIPNGLMSALNDPAAWSAQLPAANGFSTARSLSRMYAACLGEVGGVRLLSESTLAAATTPRAEGTDRVLGVESRFGLGFQLSYPLRPFAGPGSFGHYGLGGSVGFAHASRGVTFGYVVNQMLPGGMVDPRSSALIEAVFAAA
ncbi:MAG TPA: serine hydrolase domain-containing protein [Actinophytocola sp.]|jgi:CubicO group peptidase (beta-lactamase class C family)|nr:serine hydrolase domain-containing protein [Actinophytocola sp.]